MILYLEMKETGLPPLTDVGVFIRVEVADKPAAETLRDQLATQFFVGKTHEDKLHYHYTDQPCVLENL